MRPVINCIRLVGASISPEISEHLAIESVFLYRSADKKRNFKGTTYDGRIKTDRQLMGFLGVYGVFFEAEIEYEASDKNSRKVTVLFIITSSVLEIDFSRGYEFITQDFEDLFVPSDGIAEDMVRDHMGKFNNDTIGKTVGSC